MWAIHRIESHEGDLTVFARDADGGPLPPDSAESVPRLVSEHVDGAGTGTAARRPLTDPEVAREMEEIASSERLMTALAQRSPDRQQYGLVLAAMRASRSTIRFAAFEIPGAGWAADSVVDQHIPME